MKILTPDGAPAPPPITENKVHDLEGLEKEKAIADAFLLSVMQEHNKAFAQDPNKPTLVEPDAELVRTIAGEKWREFAKARNANSVAKKALDEDLVYKLIDDQRRLQQHGRTLKLPIHEIQDLTLYGFLLVGMIPQGELWISLNCAIAKAPGGPVHIWLRMVPENAVAWASGWMPVPERPHVIEMADYTLENLNTLLNHIGVGRIIPLTEDQMSACRRVAVVPRRVIDWRMLLEVGLLLVGACAMVLTAAWLKHLLHF